MTNTTPPGLQHQSETRNLLRYGGGLLALVGVLLAIWGVTQFVDAANNMDTSGNGFGDLALIGAGGFMAVIGLGLFNAGTIGAQSRYLAGETMPTVKDSVGYLTDGEGLAGVGRTVDDGGFCSQCGAPLAADAKFCSKCGHGV